jgi:hypothetical protein
VDCISQPQPKGWGKIIIKFGFLRNSEIIKKLGVLNSEIEKFGILELETPDFSRGKIKLVKSGVFKH